MAPSRIAVLGAGIAGLAAAYHCRKLAAERGLPIDIVVFERSERIGGCIETRAGDGFVLEMGPDSLVTEKPAAVELARALGLGDRIQAIRPEYRGAFVARASRLVPLPDTFRLFAPTSLRALVRSNLLSARGIMRAACEPFIPARRNAGDESLASFVTRRFGSEVLDRIAQPLIGGIYSGDPRRLSMQATMPQLLELELKYGSLVRAMRAIPRQRAGATPAPRLVSLSNGLQSLVNALGDDLRGVIRTTSDVTCVRRASGLPDTHTWRIELSGGAHVEVDSVICALPAHAAAKVFRHADDELADLLAGTRYHSVATVTMAFATQEIPPLPRGTGFVVPQVEGRGILATTFTSQKFDGRSPDSFTVLRAFIGGANGARALDAQDGDLVETVRAEFKALLGIVSSPVFTIVRRWEDALPEYELGHRERVGRIDAIAGTLYGLAFAGSAYRGVGIADCIRSGEMAAVAAFDQLASVVPSAAVGT